MAFRSKSSHSLMAWMLLFNCTTPNSEGIMMLFLLTVLFGWFRVYKRTQTSLFLCHLCTHSAGVVGVQTVEVFCRAGDGLSQCCHQLCLLYVFRFQGLCLIFPKQQGTQSGLPAQRLSPNHLRRYLFIVFFNNQEAEIDTKSLHHQKLSFVMAAKWIRRNPTNRPY